MTTSKVKALARIGSEERRRHADELLQLRHRLEDAELALTREIRDRIAAQRGLVAYMREHGEGHRVGYDPDKDPAVKKFEQPDSIQRQRSLFERLRRRLAR